MELATVVTISLAAISGGVAVFLVVEAVWPGATPDIDLLVRDPSSALTTRLRAWLVWGGGLLALATTAVWILAVRRYPSETGTMLKEKSLWELAFRDLDSSDDGYVSIRIGLADGAGEIEGFLKEYDARYDATDDRGLLVAAPIRTREERVGSGWTDSDDDYLWIAARSIAWIALRHGAPHPFDGRDEPPPHRSEGR